MSTLADEIRWSDDGLVAAVLQSVHDGRVLMQAWMNGEALQQTLDTGVATFWSRSRNALWVKGETSGNTQRVVELRLDCDGDCLLVIVDPAGPACHTGAISCFYRRESGGSWRESPPALTGRLARLDAVLKARRDASPDKSYVASLYAAGREAILRKLGEEAIETVLAGQALEPGGEPGELIHEVADLWFHSLVLLADAGLSAQDVLDELGSRTGVSGHDEKASRRRGAGEN